MIKRLEFTPKIEEGIINVPEFNLSKIENACELGIVKITDFNGYDTLKDDYAHNNRFLIILNDSTFITVDCSEFELNTFINKVIEL